MACALVRALKRIYMLKVVAVQSIMTLKDRKVSTMQLTFTTDFPRIPAELCYLLIPRESAVIWCHLSPSSPQNEPIGHTSVG